MYLYMATERWTQILPVETHIYRVDLALCDKLRVQLAVVLLSS